MKRIGGFTLLELLVSSVLTTLLMTALLSVLRSSLQTEQQTANSLVNNVSTRHLRDQIERDLINSRGLEVGNNEVTLFGYLDEDSTGMPTQRAARVRYHISSAGLVRTITGNSRQRGEGNLLWANAAAMTVATQELDDELQYTPTEIFEAGGLKPIPATIEFALFGKERQMILRFVLNHHEDLGI